MYTLSPDYTGLALIIFAFILFILEVKITSYGILTIAGVIALALGSMMLIRTDLASGSLSIPWSIIIPAIVAAAFFFFFLIISAAKAQKAKPVTGIEGMIGEEGEALARLEPSGMVRVHGELWNAESISGSIDQGQKIRVTAINNLTLQVEQVERNINNIS